MDFFTPEYLHALLGPAEQAKLTKLLIIVTLVWLSMRGKVKGAKAEILLAVDTAIDAFKKHTKAMEDQLEAGIREIRELRDSVDRDLKVQKERFAQMENKVLDLHLRVDKFETIKEQK